MDFSCGLLKGEAALYMKERTGSYAASVLHNAPSNDEFLPDNFMAVTRTCR